MYRLYRLYTFFTLLYDPPFFIGFLYLVIAESSMENVYNVYNVYVLFLGNFIQAFFVNCES